MSDTTAAGICAFAGNLLIFNAEKGVTQRYAESLCDTQRISFLCVKFIRVTAPEQSPAAVVSLTSTAEYYRTGTFERIKMLPC